MPSVKCIKIYHDLVLSRNIEEGEILEYDVERANRLNLLGYVEVIVDTDPIEPPQDKALKPTYKKK
jgi:hypothetical protein